MRGTWPPEQRESWSAEDLRRPEWMGGSTGPGEGDAAAAPRRTVLRLAGWTAPALLVVAPAPAVAASAGPFAIAADKGTGGGPAGNRLRLTFTGGVGTVTLISVVRGGTTYSSFSANPLVAPGSTTLTTNNSYVAGASYTVNYSYLGTSYSQVVTAT